jgi:peptide/nickel transport system substrate-binding protein
MSLRTRINMTIHSLSLSGKLIFYILLTIFLGSTLSLLWTLNNFFMVEVPQRGGVITEGVITLPHYINPVLAVTDSDKDLAAIVYAGLMRQTPDGTLLPDIAEKSSLSTDGKEYTFTLKPDVTFTDGTALTADDVVYTIQQVQNPSNKSPKRANWDGVLVEKIDDRTIKFTLTQPYAPFLENLTVGILPQELWQNNTSDSFALSELNTNPIGSGPYKIKAIRKNSNGIPLSYELVPNDDYTLAKPFIGKIIFKFYPTEKMLETAYQNGEIDSINGISPDLARTLADKGGKVYSAALPRVFGVFFNQSDNVALADATVRKALDMSVNRDYIVNTVLQGFGTPLMGPVPQRFIGDSPSATSTTTSYEDRVREAQTLLDNAGWILNADGIREKKLSNGTTSLTFAISTSDAPELTEVADILKSEWRKIGANVDVKVFEGGNLNQNIIRPRKYDALLFGQIVNRDLDLYAFWHSSQKTDPGLNIALYANAKADKMLENLRTLTSDTARLEEFKKFQAELATDIPAVFLYSPNFIYVASPKVKNIGIDHLTNPSERFDAVYTWYVNTEKVWKVFAR